VLWESSAELWIGLHFYLVVRLIKLQDHFLLTRCTEPVGVKQDLHSLQASEPHGHQGSGAIFHWFSDSRKRPTRVLRWFSLHHAEQLRPRSGFSTLGGGREWGGTPDFFHSSSHWCWVHCAIDTCPAKDSIRSIADSANDLRDLKRSCFRTRLLLK